MAKDLDDILTLFDEKVSAISDGSDIWEFTPPTLEEFVTSPDYLNLEPLTPRQYQDLYEVIGKDPKKIFSRERKRRRGVLLWGKGSGKDWVVAILQSYLCCVLQCYKVPQLVFGFPVNERLDLVNVSRTGENADEVFFEKLKSRIKTCRFFRNRYTIYERDRKISNPKEGKLGEIRITSDNIIFPKHIMAHSKNSSNESFEGFNILFWCMDEASAFKSKKGIENADPIYNTLVTSTRELPYVGFIISYPRHEKDFTISRYLEAAADPDGEVFGSTGYPWQIKPAKFYSGETFKFEYAQGKMVDVPIEYYDHFKKRPEDAKMKYLCMPPKTGSPYFEYPLYIDNAVNPNRKPLFVMVDHEISDNDNQIVYLVKEIIEKNLPAQKYEYCVHGDGGEVSCRGSMSIGHLENRWVETDEGRKLKDILVVDCVIYWTPDEGRHVQVSLNNMEDIAVLICHELQVRKFTMDHWNSATLIEKLRRGGVNATRRNVNDNDYALLRSMFYMGLIDMVNEPIAIEELKCIEKTERGGAQKPRGGFKDICDTIAGVCRNLIGDKDDLIEGMSGKRFPVGMAMGSALGSPYRYAAGPVSQGLFGNQSQDGGRVKIGVNEEVVTGIRSAIPQQPQPGGLFKGQRGRFPKGIKVNP